MSKYIKYRSDIDGLRATEGTSPIDCLFYKNEALKKKCSSRSIDNDDLRNSFNNSLSLSFDKIDAENIMFINPFDAFCKNGECANYTKSGYPIYIDNSHLSVYGSEMLIEELYSKFRYALRDYNENKNYYK